MKESKPHYIIGCLFATVSNTKFNSKVGKRAKISENLENFAKYEKDANSIFKTATVFISTVH